MKAARIFLGLSAALWLPYGLACLLRPSLIADAAGVAAVTATATTEVRAMYGGLQAGVGVMALAGAMSRRFEEAALLMLAFLCAGLAAGRAVGIGISGDSSAYTIFTVIFEISCAGLATWLYRQQSRA